MMVRLNYRFTTPVDVWARYIGRSVDRPLDREFWRTQPETVIGVTPYGSPPKTFTYSETLDLDPGDHYVDCATSGYAEEVPDTFWYVELWVNGEYLGKEICGRDRIVRFSFTVGAPLPWWEQPVPVLGVPLWVLLTLCGGVAGIVVVSAVVAEQERRRATSARR